MNDLIGWIREKSSCCIWGTLFDAINFFYVQFIFFNVHIWGSDNNSNPQLSKQKCTSFNILYEVTNME